MIYQFLKVHRDSCSSTTQHYKGGKTYLRMKKPVFGTFCKPSFTPDHCEWSWMDCIIRCSALWEKLSYRRKSQMKARRLCACVCVCAPVSSWGFVSFQCLQNVGQQGSRPQTWTPSAPFWKVKEEHQREWKQLNIQQKRNVYSCFGPQTWFAL